MASAATANPTPTTPCVAHVVVMALDAGVVASRLNRSAASALRFNPLNVAWHGVSFPLQRTMTLAALCASREACCWVLVFVKETPTVTLSSFLKLTSIVVCRCVFWGEHLQKFRQSHRQRVYYSLAFQGEGPAMEILWYLDCSVT